MSTDQFEKNVSTIIKEHLSGKLLLAISGGADSMAMLSSVISICASAPSREGVFVIHVEHGIRSPEESKGDAEFVRSFCEERAVPCTVITIPRGKIASFARRKGTGLEAAARHFRRRALLRGAGLLDSEKAGQQKTLILTAHTKDDALELALMRFLRGAGSSGLSAMPVRRGRFLRPLLETTRVEVLAYLKEKNIPWREDSSNADEVFLRNKIRNRLIPFLDEAFPSWKKGVIGAAQTQVLVSVFIIVEAKSRIVWKEKRRETGGDEQANNNPLPTLTTDETNFFAQPQILREESVYQAINRLFPPRFKNIKRSTLRLFCDGSVTSIDLGRLKLARKNGKIELFTVKKDFFESGVSRLIN